MASILDKLRDWLAGTPAPAPTTQSTAPSVPLDDAAVEKIMMALSMTRDDELSCAEVFALLDEYTEIAVTDKARAAELMPLVEMHLAMCADCHDGYDVLYHALESSGNSTAAAI